MIPASDYHRIVVQPSLAEFYARNRDLRLAMHAATSLTHSIDYVFQNRGHDPKAASAAAEAYRRDLGRRCFDVRVVEGFAMASKHCTLNRADLRGFSSSEQERFYPAFWGTAKWGKSFWGDKVGGVCIRWPDHGWVNLTHALRGACAILETELPELTIAPSPPHPANAP